MENEKSKRTIVMLVLKVAKYRGLDFSIYKFFLLTELLRVRNRVMVYRCKLGLKACQRSIPLVKFALSSKNN